MNFSSFAIVVLVAFLTYGVYEYLRIAPLVKASRALARDVVAFERESGEHTPHVLVAGDSTAVGVGSDPKYSVAGRLASALSVSIENVGKSGAKTKDIAEQLSHARRDSYDLAVVHVGANDVLYFTPGSDAERELDNVLPRVLEKSDRVVLLTAGKIQKAPLIPFILRPIYSLRTQHMRERFQRIAKKHDVVYVDLYALPDPFSTDPKRYYAPDMLHLSKDGYEVWYNHVRDAIQKRWPEL